MTPKILSIRYELNQQISEGPIFTTWSAKDRVGAKDVSIRLLNRPFNLEPELHQALRSVVLENQGIRHPGIERISELETDDEHVFLVGDPVRGMSLADRIQKLAPFSVPVAVGTGITVCEALASIHRAGGVHGDLGAHSIRVLPEGTAILQQTGLWKAYSASRTAGAMVLPQMAPYLAPEVSQGEMPSAASDVYAVGVLLYQLVTGELPFVGDQPISTAVSHGENPVPSAHAKNSTVPVVVDEVIKKALAKSKSDRYPSAVELLSDLRMIQDAIRFGKNLSWPLTDSPRIEPQTKVEQPAAAVPAKEKKPAAAPIDAPPGEVPNWLKGVMIFFLSLVVMMLASWFVFNVKKPKLVTVPDINRLTVAKAEEVLKPLKLKLRIARKELNDQVPADVILDSDPTPNERIYEGGTVSVRVSAGSKFVEVPDLRGMPLEKARSLLESLELRLDDRVEQESDRDVKEGMVLKQIPEPRTRVERRTAIQITVSTGRRSASSSTRNNSKYIYTIRIELSDITESVLMRVDMTDNRGTKTISEERREPGEYVELTAEGYGNQALFRIYYDGDLITQVTKKADEEVPE